MAEKNCAALGSESDTAMSCMPGCGCVGYGYVPVQELECVYDVSCALGNGTIFPELNLSICEYGKICKQWGDTNE